MFDCDEAELVATLARRKAPDPTPRGTRPFPRVRRRLAPLFAVAPPPRRSGSRGSFDCWAGAPGALWQLPRTPSACHERPTSPPRACGGSRRFRGIGVRNGEARVEAAIRSVLVDVAPGSSWWSSTTAPAIGRRRSSPLSRIMTPVCGSFTRRRAASPPRSPGAALKHGDGTSRARTRRVLHPDRLHRQLDAFATTPSSRCLLLDRATGSPGRAFRVERGRSPVADRPGRPVRERCRWRHPHRRRA